MRAGRLAVSVGSGVRKEQLLVTILCLRSLLRRADSGFVPAMSLVDWPRAGWPASLPSKRLSMVAYRNSLVGPSTLPPASWLTCGDSKDELGWDASVAGPVAGDTPAPWVITWSMEVGRVGGRSGASEGADGSREAVSADVFVAVGGRTEMGDPSAVLLSTVSTVST